MLVKLSEMVGNSPVGTVVHVVSDDPKAEDEMEKWAAITGNGIVDSRKETSFYHFLVEKK